MAGEKNSLKMKDINEALFDFKIRSLEGVTMDGLEKELDWLFNIGRGRVHAFGLGGGSP